MEKKEVIKIIDELTKKNTEYRAEVNDQLNRIRGFVEHDYNRGAADAWALARKICVYLTDGGYTSGELMDIFGTGALVVIFDNFTAAEAMTKVKEYEERKKKEEEEAQRFERGDVVEVVRGLGDSCTGIFLSDGYHYHSVLLDGESHVTQLTKDVITLRKTGKHIDLSLD